MKNKIAMSILLAVSLVSLVGCNEESAQAKHNREMDEMLKRGATAPVDRSAWANPKPVGKLNPNTGTTENYSK